MMTKKLRWKLNDVLRPEQFEPLYEEVENSIPQITSYFEKMQPQMSVESFADYLNFSEAFEVKLARLSGYPHLREALDQKDEEAKRLSTKVMDLGLKIEESSLPIDQWLKGKEVKGKEKLDDVNAARLFKALPDLEYSLNYARKAAKHTLGEKEESILTNTYVTGENVLTDLRTFIETEYEFKFKPADAKRTKILKTRAELINYVHSKNPEDRENAYRALFVKYKSDLTKYFMIYQGVVKRWDYETKLRGYESPISVRNFGNQVPDKAIEVLLEVCAANKDIYQRFFRFKAKELGVPKLQRFDIYAPLEKEDVKIPFDQALKLVDETFARFSPRFVEYARRIVTEKHVDSHPRPNKHGGAFCSTITPKVAPYVLLNYIDNAKEIFTLAHELGHGIHSLYADKHYHSTQDANLPLSETASTFGEMLLFDRMLNDTTDPKIKKSLLAEKMADSFATILRQCYFVKFEIKAHEEIQKGITSETLSDFWLETLHEQFGDAVEVDPIFKYEWANIPHIVNTPFYCYAYSFGDLLTLALYAEYKQKGSGFVPSIEKILEAGGSRNPVEVLSEVGVDIQSKEFWQKSFELIRDWQEQLEKL